MTAHSFNAEQWKRIEDLFHDAIQIDPENRAAFLDEECAEDSAVRREVERLLRHGEHTTFLDAPPMQSVIANIAADSDVNTVDPLDHEGAKIGPYRLVQHLASGGMGMVWRAERIDGGFQQHVAVKLIKHGMVTEDMLQRFRNERQLLAGFEHPNIARLLDGGATADGRPYLVMEFIDGVPIDQYCNDHMLNLRHRLELFQRVCMTVHEAHKNLIVHRDLKPTNVLVTADGEPKLLDFGIAKVIAPAGQAQASLTVTGRRVLTPLYASPEQVRGEAITTASDVYSLGVILYELLTGRRPFDITSDSQREIERLVLEHEPARPSMVVNRPATRGDDESHGTCAGLPEINVRRLSRMLNGDVDTIVMMALRKEPQRRYGSAEELASDIARHLRDDPITARPDTWRYRSGKFARRNRGALTAAAFILLIVVVGASIASIGWVRALRNERAAQEALINLMREGLRQYTDEQITARADAAGLNLSLKREGELRFFYIDFSEGRQVPQLAAFAEQIVIWLEEERVDAEAARQEAERIIRFLNDDLLATANPSIFPTGKLTMREALDRAANSVETRFAGQPRIEAPIRRTIGDTYRSLGLPKHAIPHLAKAAELYEATHGLIHEKTRAVTRAWADALYLDGQHTVCLDLCRKLLERDIETDGYESASAMATRHLLVKSGGAASDDERIAELHTVMEWSAAHLGEAHVETLAVMHTLANDYIFAHEFEKAEPIINRVWQATRDAYGKSHPETLWAMLGKAIITDRLGDTEAAVELLQEAVRLHRETKGDDYTNMGITLVHLGNHLDTLERFDESEAAYLEAYGILERSLGPENSWTSDIIPYLVKLYERTGREDQAAIWREKLLDPKRD